MGIVIARWILAAVGTYLALGLIFAGPFIVAGAGHIDPGARGSPWGFRLLMVPGVIALWPFLARRWVEARRGRS